MELSGGALTVQLSIRDGRIGAVDIVSTRPQGASRAFAGKDPQDIARHVGLIFSLCSNAQTVASLMAIEQAGGVSVSASQTAARDLLRLSEMFSQTALRVMMDWPRVLGLPPATEGVRRALAVQAALAGELFADGDWKRLGGGALRPDVSAIGAQIDALHALAVQCQPDDVLHALDAEGLNGFGALSADAQPELGALARRWDDEAVRDARMRFGAGLRARFLARVADLADIPGQMRRVVAGLNADDPLTVSLADGEGRATVETARGPLTHRCALKDGVITAYEIAAPTDDNFRPGGVVAAGLMGVEVAADGVHLRTACELHILAVDPCVSCNLEIVSR